MGRVSDLLRSARFQAVFVAITTAASVGWNARLDAPPRYDGAGYAVLARSILAGSGYREIDHPVAPPHAHFPPGYPLILAGLWRMAGISAASAHLISIGCTVASAVLAWNLYRSWYGPRVALLLGLALAVNWRVGRDGSEIRSEPAFILLSLAAVRLSGWGREGKGGRAVVVGMILGAAILTRHVGACLAGAILADWLIRRKVRAAIIAAGVMVDVVAPWFGWMMTLGRQTQVELLPGRGLAGVAAENLVFYGRRLPDQWLGPVVEIATVFLPKWSALGTAGALLASSAIVAGWGLALRSSRRRLVGLIPLATLGLLLIWPFTEAGRFLVPLIPFVLVGLVEGLAPLIAKAGWRHPRGVAAGLVLAGSIPYAGYAALTDRAEAGRRTHAAFDEACRWIADHGQDHPGPVLSRHPGEVFWLSGREAIAPFDGADDADVADLIDDYRVEFLLIDEARYANAPKSLLEVYAEAHPDRVERVHGTTRAAMVYRVRRDRDPG